MNARALAFIGTAIIAAAAWYWRRNFNTQEVTTAAVRREPNLEITQIAPATPDNVIPRFSSVGRFDDSTAAGAARLAAEKITYAAKNPVQAFAELFTNTDGLIASANPARTAKYTSQFDKKILHYSRINKVDPRIVKQLLIQESSMNPHARGSRGELGLGQFMAATWRDVGKGRDPLDPDAAIDATTEYLRQLLDWSDGTYESALESYNGGIGNWQRGTVSAAAEAYADKIIARSGIDKDPEPDPDSLVP